MPNKRTIDLLTSSYGDEMSTRRKYEFKNAKGVNSLFVLKSCKNVIKSIERQIYKEGTNVPDKDSGFDDFNDALGYLVEYNFPVRRDFKPNPLQRWS